jgi:transcriptional regulator with XRE-family HTH domain
LLIKQRLEELGLGQKDLAAAAEVTESYISQLLTRKKPPPAPDQSDIYERMAELLKLPRSHLSELADAQRAEEFKRKLGDPAAPLYKEIRELILRRCSAAEEKQIRAIFEKQPFGELERLVSSSSSPRKN